MGGFISTRQQRQWLLTAGILLLLGAAIAYDLWRDRCATEAVENDRLLVQARVIDENLSRHLLATNQSLRRILSDLPYWRAGNTYRPVADLMLKTIEEAMPGVRTLLIIDAKGIARASNRAELIGRDLSRREYFQTVRRLHDPSALYLSLPYTTALNVYAMNLSRMVPGPAGEFNGILVATLDPDYFGTLLASVQYAPDMWAAVAHGDGTQFLMVPYREGQSGKDLAQPRSFFSRHRDSGRTESIMSGRVYATGEERVMAIRSIQPAGAHLDKPLVVAVGRDLHAIFAEWRREALTHGGVFLGIVLITVFSVRYSQARERRADEQAGLSKAALEKSEARYRILAENTTDVVWQLDLRTMKYTYVSPSVLSLRGYTPEEVMAQPIEASLTPDSRKNVQAWMGQMLEEFTHGRTDPHASLKEVEQPRRDGSTVWTEVSTTYVLNAEHQPIAVIGISRDITERKRAEEELLQTSALLRTFMDAIDESAFLMDREGRILAANETVAKRFNKTVPEFVGSKIEDVLSPEMAVSRGKHVNEVIRTGRLVRFEDERMGRTIDNSIYPVFDSRGEVNALAVIGHDITERKLAAEEREKLIAELQKALAEIRTLHGILPICSNCKKIRDDKGAWHQMETYIHDHTDAEFSHGLCADCAKKMYPKYFKDK